MSWLHSHNFTDHPRCFVLTGDSSDKRFMAYSALGCIICKEGEECNVLEVAMHDTRAQRRRMPHLNDLYRFSMAALGDRVSALIAAYIATAAHAVTHIGVLASCTCHQFATLLSSVIGSNACSRHKSTSVLCGSSSLTNFCNSQVWIHVQIAY